MGTTKLTYRFKRFRKRPLEVCAVQFKDNADTLQEILDFMQCSVTTNYNDPKNPHIVIHTLEGDMRAEVGDWILRGLKGEFYPCKPDIFEMAYELVEE